MNDLRPHKHGDEGVGSTHAVCNKHNIGGKSVCCECTGKTDCEATPPPTSMEERFDERFPDITHVSCLDHSLKCATMANDVKKFISSEIKLAVEKREGELRETIEKILKSHGVDVPYIGAPILNRAQFTILLTPPNHEK